MFFFDVTILSVCGGVACMGLVFKVQRPDELRTQC